MANLIPITQLAESTPNVAVTYTSGQLTGIVKTEGGVTISSKVLTYASGRLSQVAITSGGTTKTKTLNYTDAVLTSITVS